MGRTKGYAMKEVDLIPIDDIIDSLMRRENVYDLAVVISHGDKPETEDWKWTYFHKGDPVWLRKKIDYKLLPDIEEAIEDEEEYE